MTVPLSYFDRMYADDTDPWGFADRWYERRKRALTLAALPHPRYRSAFEPGCSTGWLTAGLADRCDALFATDVVDAPLQEARARLAANPQVRLAALRVPQEWPAGPFDLIVLSELGYYFGSDDLAALRDRAVRSLEPGGVLLACHWRHPVDEYPVGGDEVHDVLAAHPELTVLVEHREEDFRLDVLVRGDPRSVAHREGLT